MALRAGETGEYLDGDDVCPGSNTVQIRTRAGYTAARCTRYELLCAPIRAIAVRETCLADDLSGAVGAPKKPVCPVYAGIEDGHHVATAGLRFFRLHIGALRKCRRRPWRVFPKRGSKVGTLEAG